MQMISRVGGEWAGDPASINSWEPVMKDVVQDRDPPRAAQ